MRSGIRRAAAVLLALALMLPLFSYDASAVNSAAPASTASRLSAGRYHTLELTPSGELYAWGDNRYGQLGDGLNASRAEPMLIMRGVKDFAAGQWASYAISASGDLYAWGNGEQGQLGLGDNTSRSVPTKVLGNVKQVATALNRAYALTEGGLLYAWGNASWAYPDGQRLENRPRVVARGVDEVFCGGSTTLLLRGGVLTALGGAASGSVADGVASEVNIASGVSSAAATSGEILYIDGSAQLHRCASGKTSKLLTNIKKVGMSDGRCFVLSNVGTLYTWGTNTSGELGLGHRATVTSPTAALHNVADAAIGGGFIVAEKTNGERWASGSNRYYQLGSGTNRLDYNTFVRMGGGSFELGQLGSGAYRVVLDGEQLTFDVDPLNRSGRLLVPMRAIFEALGATVSWNQTTQTASAKLGGRSVSVTIGSTVATVDGARVETDVAAEKHNWRTLVPLRFVSDALGADVEYIASERLVEIRSRDSAFELTASMKSRLALQSVGITATLPNGVGTASGVAVHSGGLIITNAHVVENATALTVKTSSGRSYPAEVYRVSGEYDYALIKVAATLNAAEPSITAPKVEDAIIIHDGSTGTAHLGSVTLDGYGGSSLLTDISLSRGASGSGAYNRDEELVGIVWASSGEKELAAVLPALAFYTDIAEAADYYGLE